MNTTTKLLLMATTVFAFGTIAFADDPQGRNMLDLQRRNSERNRATIAVYTHGRGLAPAVAERRTDTRLKEHEMGRGTRHFFVAPAK